MTDNGVSRGNCTTWPRYGIRWTVGLLSAVTGDEHAPEGSWVAEAGPWTSAREREAMAIERDADDIARAFLLERVLFDLTGAKSSGGALYGTDGGWFTSSGIVSLICGPGDLDQAHQPNEYIRREPFERCTAMVHQVIERMCNRIG